MSGSDGYDREDEHEDVETYSGSPRMPNIGILVCAVRGHNWVSDGITGYSCERCGRYAAAWRVKNDV